MDVFVWIMRLSRSRIPDINLFYVSINSLVKKSWLCNSLDYFVMSLWLSVLYCLKPAFFDIFLFHWI
ncbi:hypothetical protein EV03_1853 [Prochlorococcus marinus str. PAC1]|uniref:Uncharacterized protein n=1 Tax=Prochlorococcus marinus str. PAC1 TaxID=59924 RepID=A0A0A2C3J2_PROMR|nr:hypothetical protein EV03_1853 [Prochlorococcus marinus str. PAC1]